MGTIKLMKSLLTREGSAIINMDPELSPSTIEKLKISEVSILDFQKHLKMREKWEAILQESNNQKIIEMFFGKDNTGAGFTVISMLIKENREQNMAELAATYSRVYMCPYVVVAVALTALYRQRGFYYIAEDKKKVKWEPKRKSEVRIPTKKAVRTSICSPHYQELERGLNE